MNHIFLVGRVVNKKENHFQISVNRLYKNENDKCDSDIIDISIAGNIAESFNEFCNRGSIVGIKGHIEKGNIIVADKISFLAQKDNK